MPDGTDDPVKFIRTLGIKAFRDLERLDVFSWRLKEAIKRGEDPEDVVMAEVFRRVDSDRVALREQKATLIRRMVDKINQDADTAVFVLEETAAQLAAVEDGAQGFSVARMVTTFRESLSIAATFKWRPSPTSRLTSKRRARESCNLCQDANLFASGTVGCSARMGR